MEHAASTSSPILKHDYATFYPLAQPKSDQWRESGNLYATFIYVNKPRFQEIEAQTKVSWPVVGVINVMERGLDFGGTLLNGDDWDKVTKHYPSGLGPWKSWEEAAVFAIQHENAGWHRDMSTWTWDVGGTFLFLEQWNGLNARLPEGAAIVPPHAPPYIYSGTQFYTSGKRGEKLGDDGKYHGYFDPNTVSQQPGCMLILKCLEQLGEKVFQ